MTSLQPSYTYFRCITCETIPQRIHELAPIKGVPIIEFHKGADCKIEYFTNDTCREYSQSVTPDGNTNRGIGGKKKHSMMWFIHKATIINRMGFDFSRDDFPEITAESFRKKIHDARKKELIEKVSNSLVPSFRVIGEPTNKERGTVTLKRMGVGLEFEKLLQDTCISYPKIHDIRIKIPTEGLHRYLKQSCPMNKKNGRIYLGKYQLKPYTFATISVYPSMAEIIIECSRLPIVYDTNGAQELIVMLTELRDKLMFRTHFQVNDDIPSALEWIVTQYHFNKDGRSRQYSGEHFEVKVKEMCAGMFRFYDKRFPDGITRTRLEQIRSPQSNVLDVITEMIKTDHFVHGISGIKLTREEARKILDIMPNMDDSDSVFLDSSKKPVIIVNWSSFFNPMQDRLFSF